MSDDRNITDYDKFSRNFTKIDPNFVKILSKFCKSSLKTSPNIPQFFSQNFMEVFQKFLKIFFFNFLHKLSQIFFEILKFP